MVCIVLGLGARGGVASRVPQQPAHALAPCFPSKPPTRMPPGRSRTTAQAPATSMRASQFRALKGRGGGKQVARGDQTAAHRSRAVRHNALLPVTHVRCGLPHRRVPTPFTESEPR